MKDDIFVFWPAIFFLYKLYEPIIHYYIAKRKIKKIDRQWEEGFYRFDERNEFMREAKLKENE